MDPEIVRLSEQLAAAVGSAIAAKPLLERLLGPSFEYAGKSIAALLERYGNTNLTNVFRRAAAKLADSNEPVGYVNPRVLRAIIEDASYSADIVTAEYFAGLLAVSARGNGEDDRAMTFLSIVRSLTSGQIRLHHLTYSLLRTKYADSKASFTVPRSVRLFIPDDVVTVAGIEVRSPRQIELLAGLARELLISSDFDVSRRAVLPRTKGSYPGLVVGGSLLGAQLFLWVHGQTDVSPDELFSSDLVLRDWERTETGAVGTATDLDAHATARDLVREALQLCDHATDTESLKELVKVLRKLSNWGRFTSDRLYETIQRLPSTGEMLHIDSLRDELMETRDYLEGTRTS